MTIKELHEQKVKKQEVDYQELYLREKMARIQAEINSLQMKFTECQNALQITNMELTKYLESKETPEEEKATTKK